VGHPGFAEGRALVRRFDKDIQNESNWSDGLRETLVNLSIAIEFGQRLVPKEIIAREEVVQVCSAIVWLDYGGDLSSFCAFAVLLMIFNIACLDRGVCLVSVCLANPDVFLQLFLGQVREQVCEIFDAEGVIQTSRQSREHVDFYYIFVRFNGRSGCRNSR
jgi:hypothetical protein